MDIKIGSVAVYDPRTDGIDWKLYQSILKLNGKAAEVLFNGLDDKVTESRVNGRGSPTLHHYLHGHEDAGVPGYFGTHPNVGAVLIVNGRLLATTENRNGFNPSTLERIAAQTNGIPFPYIKQLPF